MGACKITSLSLFALGMILMVLNTAGLFKSLRNEELYSELKPYEDDIAVRFEETRKSWDRAIDECRNRQRSFPATLDLRVRDLCSNLLAA